MMRYKFLRWMYSTRWMDERFVTPLDWFREDDGGDLRRSELNELVENTTCLGALEGKRIEN